MPNPWTSASTLSLLLSLDPGQRFFASTLGCVGPINLAYVRPGLARDCGLLRHSPKPSADQLKNKVVTGTEFGTLAQLKNEMMAHDMDGLEEVERRWNEEYRHRKIVNGFMKDKVGFRSLGFIKEKRLSAAHSPPRPPRLSHLSRRHSLPLASFLSFSTLFLFSASLPPCPPPHSPRPSVQGIGSKRLASMPDRITNTINTSDGSIVMRPTVTNGFDGNLSAIDKWWTLWKDFVFRFVVQVYKKDGVSPPQVVCKLIEPILHSKYPAITPEEQVAKLAHSRLHPPL